MWHPGGGRYHHLDGGLDGVEGAVATAVLAEGEAQGAAGEKDGTRGLIIILTPANAFSKPTADKTYER